MQPLFVVSVPALRTLIATKGWRTNGYNVTHAMAETKMLNGLMQPNMLKGLMQPARLRHQYRDNPPVCLPLIGATDLGSTRLALQWHAVGAHLTAAKHINTCG